MKTELKSSQVDFYIVVLVLIEEEKKKVSAERILTLAASHLHITRAEIDRQPIKQTTTCYAIPPPLIKIILSFLLFVF